MKKFTTTILILFMSLMALPASFKLGAGITFEHDMVAPEYKYMYKNVAEYIEVNDINKIDKIHRTGPRLELIYEMPFAPWWQIELLTETLMVTGASSPKEKMYLPRNWDLKQNVMLSTTFSWIFMNNTGLYGSFFGKYSYTQMADQNIKNSRLPVTYYNYNDFHLGASLGIMTKIDSGYFKLGYDYSHSMITDNSTTALIVSGGIKF